MMIMSAILSHIISVTRLYITYRRFAFDTSCTLWQTHFNKI